MKNDDELFFAQIVVNGNCAICGKELPGSNIFICADCQRNIEKTIGGESCKWDAAFTQKEMREETEFTEI
ncbi:MAG: hypothetical protein IJ828_01285 [Treponema sp.]|nr:hypothetical protein [Treponema sp.]